MNEELIVSNRSIMKTHELALSEAAAGDPTLLAVLISHCRWDQGIEPERLVKFAWEYYGIPPDVTRRAIKELTLH